MNSRHGRAVGSIARITETDNLGVVGWVEFEYDNRGRLTQEVQVGEHPYHIAYEYDQGGNRTRKVQSLPGCDRIETTGGMSGRSADMV